MNIIAKLMIAVAALTMPAFGLAAQDNANPVALKGDVKAEKIVTDADGAERIELVEPTSIVPGDRLVFGTDYANNGADAVTNFVVTNPLPAAVRLAPDADPALDVSVDGGKTWGALAALTFTNSDGTTRPAAHADVTHVRWVLASIAPGASGRLTYPAIIR
ncbi:hypothetical protein CHX26_08935 [Porphyrobacter sp. HT-58-2]|uniref:hypothetical protein n=1 Tax=Porphyrobacter sp. HT-58-2 TaxID=2023229 RepID=UPI000CDBD091|nr:hypothetical protein [Porphyrobacter sp. HT-58-2]AUX69601.1 hypothetical protein CHX26_08935 [Porphyrobacter sp. HT-58-2]